MARNRKKQNSGLFFWPVVKASLLCGVIVVCCVGYVWQKKQIADLSQDIQMDEKRLDALHESNDKLKRQLAGLLSPTALDARAQELKLGLAPAQQNQIWRLPEPGTAPAVKQAALKREEQFVAGPIHAGL